MLDDGRLRIGVLFYRAHETSGNAGFAHALADAIDAGGEAVGLPIFSASLRSAPDELFDALGDPGRADRDRPGRRRQRAGLRERGR